MNIVDLYDACNVSLEMIGSKAWNLSAMLREGFPVPAGFVLTSSAFQQFLRANDLLAHRHLADFVDVFMRAAIPAAIVEELQSYYTSLHQNEIYAVAVRSSSALEDLTSASFAGQYETFLNVRSFNELLLSIKRCWFSFFSPLVQEYASHQHISLDSLNMGILVQGMIAADVSGVIFSKNPVTNNEQEIMINASYGLGEGVVSGLVTPDLFLLDKKSGHVTRELGLKEVKVVPSDSGIETIETNVEEQEAFCMSDEEITAIGQLTRQVERYYSKPVDIEFAVANRQLFVLQVRPITT